jgi:molecular chaperone DnaK (HSP70)
VPVLLRRHFPSCLLASQSTTATPTTTATTTRSYHATNRREILPLVGAAAVLLVARYSYRALNRMEAEWEDYQWQLQQYERRRQGQGGGTATPHDAVHSVQTMAIDLGTVYSKIACSHVGTKGKAEVVVSREGDRYFFNGVVLDPPSADASADDDENQQQKQQQQKQPAVLGRQALERFFFPEGDQVAPVQLPWAGLLASKPDTGHLVAKVLSPVLEETLERLESKNEATRFVVTVPSLLAHTDNLFQEAFATSVSPQSIFVPDPVAAVWGAQAKDLLVSLDSKVLVVDVGGYLTQLSIVERDRLRASLVFPWGGETVVEKSVQILRDQSAQPIADDRGLSALQVQARAAVAELASRTQVPVHVPYIFATPGEHHLDTHLSRSVVEQAVQSEIGDLARTDDMGSLSKHMPTPTNLEMLFLSIITELLEQSNDVPNTIDHILLVGGASRFPLVRTSLLQAMALLMTADVAQAKLVHDPSLAPELTVLGAANILPAYGYDLRRGLVRNEGGGELK